MELRLPLEMSPGREAACRAVFGTWGFFRTMHGKTAGSAKSLQSYLIRCDRMDCSLPGSSVHGILQAEYWSGLPCPPPGDLPDPGIELTSPVSTALRADSLLAGP